MSDAALSNSDEMKHFAANTAFAPSAGNECLCFHCQLPVPLPANYQLMIKGKNQPMCCPGCVAAASMILSANLSHYYDYRDICDSEGSPEPQSNNTVQMDEREFEAWAKAEQIQQYCTATDNGLEAELIISGIRCAACVWLLEHYLTAKLGIDEVNVNFANHRAYVRFDPKVLDITAVFVAIAQLGYKAFPYVASIEEEVYQNQRRTLLKALGVSAIGVMQVMMFTIALYAGAFEGMNPVFESLLRWASLFVATPVVLYSARLFFITAWRDARNSRAGMDLPVSLAIGGAYVASLVNTVWLNGQVYFESVSMFTFFLLLSRFIELNARQKQSLLTNELTSVFPAYALKYDAGQVKSVLLNELAEGDRILIETGATIAADGVIVNGDIQIDESAFSGESLPLRRQCGDKVFAGSINVQNPFDMTVVSLPKQSLLSNMVKLAQRAAADKPKLALLADSIAGYFVLLVLGTTLAASVYWYFVEPDKMIAIALAVLVVSCPCALSLATPVALSVGNKKMLQLGLMPTTGTLLTGLADVDTIAFDKTGTLTDGKLDLQKVVTLQNVNESQLIEWAIALEQGVNHPLAKALREYGSSFGQVSEASETQVVQGGGVSGKINGKYYYLGNPEFACESAGITVPSRPECESGTINVLLIEDAIAVGWFVFNDQLRMDARQAVSQLATMGKSIKMVSGDSFENCRQVAKSLKLNEFRAAMKPQDKIEYLKQLIDSGHKVLMVGDGINDAAALKLAHVSVAMNSASEFVQAKADGVLLNGQLQVVVEAVHLAEKTRGITRQNMLWALLYNLCALPLAVLGFIPPWFAALGMSLSSLIVLMNSYRLNGKVRGIM